MVDKDITDLFHIHEVDCIIQMTAHLHWLPAIICQVTQSNNIGTSAASLRTKYRTKLLFDVRRHSGLPQIFFKLMFTLKEYLQYPHIMNLSS